MAKISILVAAYNKEDYIGACLDSLTSQTYEDLEIVVVDDASTDGTLAIIKSVAQSDSRVKVLERGENGGRHCVRKQAVEAATGDYAMFVDGDDELVPTACEVLESYARGRSFDMIRYGLEVCASTDADRSLVYSYEQMFNATNGNLKGDDILKSSFSNDLVCWTAWNVNLIFYKTKVLQEAFSLMEVSRLNKIEDAYEYFVLASCAKQLYSLTEFRALRYYIGRGISGRSQVSLEVFNDDQQSAYDVVQAFRRFADQTKKDMVTRAVGWFDYRARKIVADDFETRLHSGDQAQAVQKLSQTWGKEATADMLLDLMLKRANWLWGIDKYPQPNDDIVRWNELFTSLKPKKFESDVVRQKYKNYTEVWGDIEFRERARVEQEKQKLAERERERQEEERARIFRKDTLPRMVLEGVFPDGTKRRGALSSLGHAVLRR